MSFMRRVVASVFMGVLAGLLALQVLQPVNRVEEPPREAVGVGATPLPLDMADLDLRAIPDAGLPVASGLGGQPLVPGGAEQVVRGHSLSDGQATHSSTARPARDDSVGSAPAVEGPKRAAGGGMTSRKGARSDAEGPSGEAAHEGRGGGQPLTSAKAGGPIAQAAAEAPTPAAASAAHAGGIAQGNGATQLARDRARVRWASNGTLAELRAARGLPQEPVECTLTRPVRIVLHPKLRMGTKVDNKWAPEPGTGLRACIPNPSACRDEQCRNVSPKCQVAMAEPASDLARKAEVFVAYGFLVHHAAQRFVQKEGLSMAQLRSSADDRALAMSASFRRFMQSLGTVPPEPQPRQLLVLYNRDITALPLFAQKAFNATVGYDLYAADLVCPAFLPSVEHLRRRRMVPVEKRRFLASSLVSDCGEFSGRDGYITELEKHMPVSRMGMCNHNKDLPCDTKPKKERFNVSEPCPLSPNATEKERERVVTQHLMQYKFHLSFERVRCEGYVSEKVFNPLTLGVVPVYLGSPLVEKVAVSSSSPWVINAHAFESPKALANYLLHLDTHPDEYKQYLAWRQEGGPVDASYSELSARWSVPRSSRLCQLCALYCEYMRRFDTTGEPFVSRASACPDPAYNPTECSAGRRCPTARQITPLPYLTSQEDMRAGRGTQSLVDSASGGVFSPATIKAQLLAKSTWPHGSGA